MGKHPMKNSISKLNRRDLFRLGGATLLGAGMARGEILVPCTSLPPSPTATIAYPYDIAIQTGLTAAEVFPTSPFILEPFRDPLPIPGALRPGYRRPDGTLAPTATDAWTVREAFGRKQSMVCAPGPGSGSQDSIGSRARFCHSTQVPDAGTHQLWTDGSGASGTGRNVRVPGFPLPNPVLYHIRLRVDEHTYTSSAVQPIGPGGVLVAPPAGSNAIPLNGGFKLP